MVDEEMNPFIKSGFGDLIFLAEFIDGAASDKIFI